jgi:hypothetical protein
MLAVGMWLGRVRCALALLWVAACSFPEYAAGGATGGVGATSSVNTASCSNDRRDGDELGVDCGPSCRACPVCSDTIQNGDETGVDCGGQCGPCPTCDDGLQNGSESDRDCGGTCTARCETNQRCRSNSDCGSLVCASVCQPSDCNDQVRNGLETGRDCGGSCPACDNGTACRIDSDCVSMRCQNEVCVSAGCTDTILNGKETDTDCGGDECAPCATDDKCKLDRDCQSLVCQSTASCAAATCSDSTQNQGESDVDCGGTACAPCAEGRACLQAGDCASALCQSGMCVPEFPRGQPLSGATWSIETSERTTESGPLRAIDSDVETCWSSGRPQYAGMYVQLDLGEPRYFFKALVRVTAAAYQEEFPAGLDVYISNDGTFGDPVQMSIMGSSWTWIDLPGAQVGRYLRFVATKDAPRNWSISDIDLYN